MWFIPLRYVYNDTIKYPPDTTLIYCYKSHGVYEPKDVAAFTFLIINKWRI
jgi:hypothetical protein